jgi:hypothetical protein
MTQGMPRLTSHTPNRRKALGAVVVVRLSNAIAP